MNPVEQAAAQWEAMFPYESYVPASPLETALRLYIQQLTKAYGMAAGGDPGDITRIARRVREHMAGDTERLIKAFVDAGYRRADAEVYFDRLHLRLQGDLIHYFGQTSTKVLKPAKLEDARVADEFFAKAQELYQKRDYAEAIKAMDDCLRFAPYNVRLTLETALRQLAGGQLAEARANFDLARERYPKVVNLFAGLGMIRGAVGDYLGSIVDLTTAIYLEPRAARAYSLRGIARQALDDYEGAIDDYGLQIANGYPEGLAYIHVRRGWAHYMLGHIDNAQADFEAAIQVDPTYAPAYRELGIVHARRRDHQASLVALNKVVELQPNRPEGYSPRIWAHLELGNIEAALQDADRVVALGRDKAFNHLSRAVLLDLAERPDPAETEYLEAIAVAQRSHDTKNWYYTNLQLDMFRRRWGRAMDIEYLKDVPEWPDDWPKRIALQLTGRITAESLLQTAGQAATLRERINHACEANYYIGTALWFAGEHDSALPYLRASSQPQYTGNLEYFLARKLLRQVEARAVENPAKKPNGR